MAETKEKIVQLKDRDMKTLLYPNILGKCIPAGSVSNEKLAQDVSNMIAGNKNVADLLLKGISESGGDPRLYMDEIIRANLIPIPWESTYMKAYWANIIWKKATDDIYVRDLRNPYGGIRGLKGPFNELRFFDIPYVDSSGGTFAENPLLTSVIVEGSQNFFRHTFRNDYNLKYVRLHRKYNITKGAFQGCSSLSSIETSRVTTLGENTFQGCTSLTSIEIPNVTSIPYYCFQGCTSLTSIEMPSVTSIDESAFRDCSSLETIIVGSEIKKISTKAFGSCPIKTAFIQSATPPSIDADAFSNSIESIYVPDDSLEAYEGTTNWSRFADKLKAMGEFKEYYRYDIR